MCFQNQSDMVSVISNEQETPQVMPYKKFIQFISFYLKERIEEFYTTLNRFLTIYIDCKTGVWQEVPVEKEESSFEELLTYNETIEQQKENAKSFVNRDYIKKLKDVVYDIKNRHK
jgi:hypothetical protein